mgnify:CR=1 FL=1
MVMEKTLLWMNFSTPRSQNLGYPEVSPMLLTNLRIMVRKFLIASCKSNTSKGEHLAALEILDPR